MCTVTFYITDAGIPVLTSNRDEKIHRATQSPQKKTTSKATKYIAPTDEVAKGTWIALDEHNNYYCLLNGAGKKHVPKGNYKKSRGQIILDLLEYENVEQFSSQYDFSGIEPFTLVVFQNKKLYELVWNENTLMMKQLNELQHHIWSSATLYTEEEKEKKAEHYLNLFQCKIPSKEEIIAIHSLPYERGGFLFNDENGTKTVSISQLSLDSGRASFYYKDLLLEI